MQIGAAQACCVCGGGTSSVGDTLGPGEETIAVETIALDTLTDHTGPCRDDTDCRLGEFCGRDVTTDTFQCKMKKSLGKICSKDGQCESGLCKASKYQDCHGNQGCPFNQYCDWNPETFHHTCQYKKSKWQSCFKDRDCQSGNCMRSNKCM